MFRSSPARCEPPLPCAAGGVLTVEETRVLVSARLRFPVTAGEGVAVRLEDRVASRVLFRSLVSGGLTPQRPLPPSGRDFGWAHREAILGSRGRTPGWWRPKSVLTMPPRSPHLAQGHKNSLPPLSTSAGPPGDLPGRRDTYPSGLLWPLIRGTSQGGSDGVDGDSRAYLVSYPSSLWVCH